MSCHDLLVSDDRCGHTTLPVNPFVSNRYHFGMLLGVADFETDQAYHRGKAWLHNAWLHGSGVIWGLDVEIRAEANEVVVAPGLAIDGHGRELSVSEPMCVDLGAWFAQRRPDELEVGTRPDGDLTFTVHVELCHDSCLDRPVPSISEPCEDAGFDTAYSRAVERGLPRIVVPRPAPAVNAPRLREFFGQSPVTHDSVTAARAAVEAAAPADRAAVCLDWFRRLAAADVTELAPEPGGPSWSPIAGDGCVPLAELRVRLHPDGDGFTIVVADAPDQPAPPDDGSPDTPADAEIDSTVADTSIRPSLLRTRTIQELLCHDHSPVPPNELAGGAGGHVSLAAPSTPFRAVAGSATADGATVELRFTADVDPVTVRPAGFSVSVLRADGWHDSTIDRAAVAEGDAGLVRLTLSGAPRSRPLRVVASGTGTRPILAVDGSVLAGVEGDPVIPSGSDAALMITHTGTPGED